MQKLLISCLILTTPLSVIAADKTYNHDGRQLIVDNATGAVTIVADGDTVVKSNIPAWGLDGNIRRPDALRNVRVASRNISDIHGKALRVSVSGSYENEKATVDYDIYPEFILTRLSVDAPSGSKEDFSLNFLAPVSTRETYRLPTVPATMLSRCLTTTMPGCVTPILPSATRYLRHTK